MKLPEINEKRKKRRIDVDVSLRYRDIKEKSKTLICTLTKNISENGVRFTTDRYIPLSHSLFIEIDLVLHSRPVRAIGKVVWIKKFPVGEFYEVGNRFLEISDEDKRILQEYVNCCSVVAVK